MSSSRTESNSLLLPVNVGNMLKHVYASQMPLVDLANKVKEGRNHETSSNFNSNSVLVSFLPGDEHSRGMHLDPGLLKLYNTNAITKSVLLESDSICRA